MASSWKKKKKTVLGFRVCCRFLCIHMPDTFCLIHSLPEVIFEKEFCGSGVEWDRRLCVEFQLCSTLRLWKQELKCKLIMLGRREGACPSLCAFPLQCRFSGGSPGQLTVLFLIPREKDRC